jgi:hypothetical protein
MSTDICILRGIFIWAAFSVKNFYGNFGPIPFRNMIHALQFDVPLVNSLHLPSVTFLTKYSRNEIVL